MPSGPGGVKKLRPFLIAARAASRVVATAMAPTGVSQTRAALSTVSKVMQTPSVALQIGRALFHRRVVLPLDYHFRDGRSRPFDLLHIKIVNACNLRCTMCGQWGETGYHLNQPPAFLRELVPIERYLRLIDELQRVRPWLSVSGGEPFLYPGLLRLLRYAKKKRFTVTLSTNGLSLADHADELVEIGVDFMYVSIDGPRQTHDVIRGLDGAFDKTAAGIRALQRSKKAARRLKPYVLISGAMSRHNERNFEGIFELAEDVQADGLVASYGWFQTEESCRQHESLMSARLDTAPVAHRGWLWSYSSIDANVLTDTVKRIKSRRWSFPYAFMPDLTYDEIPTYYQDHSRTFGVDKCICAWSVVEILPNGDVATCVDMPDYVVGNIRDGNLLDIWNNDRYRKFRRVLKEEGHFPACCRCSGLVGRGL